MIVAGSDPFVQNYKIIAQLERSVWCNGRRNGSSHWKIEEICVAIRYSPRNVQNPIEENRGGYSRSVSLFLLISCIQHRLFFCYFVVLKEEGVAPHQHYRFFSKIFKKLEQKVLKLLTRKQSRYWITQKDIALCVTVPYHRQQRRSHDYCSLRQIAFCVL